MPILKKAPRSTRINLILANDKGHILSTRKLYFSNSI